MSSGLRASGNHRYVLIYYSYINPELTKPIWTSQVRFAQGVTVNHDAKRA
jgi:hypothetical protein